MLRLRTTTSTSSGSAGAHTVRLAGGGWTETGLTFANRPALAAVLGTLPARSTADTTYDVVLSASQVAGLLGGELSIGIDTTSSDGLQVVSKEGPGVRPVLTLTFG